MKHIRSRLAILVLVLALAMAAIAHTAMPMPVSAAIAQRGSATTATTNNANLTINRPLGVVAGDVMIVNIAKIGNNTTAPSLAGWTLVDGRSLGGMTQRHGAVLYKVAGGSEPASYTFALGAGTSGAVGSIVAFSGVDTSGATPFDVAPGTISVQPNQVAVVATSITTASANAAVIMCGMAANSSPTWSGWTTTSPGALTELYDNQKSTGNQASVGAAWATKATAGATGAGGATLSGAQRNGGILIALKPAPNPVPTTTSISPTTKTYGDAGFTLTVNGTNFVPTSVVRLDGADRTTTYSSSTQLTATIPASDLLAVGSENITVFNPTPGGGTSNAQTLTVNAKDITVTADDQGKTYGDADPALTYQITSGSLVGSDNFTGAIARVAGESVGTYDIEQGTLALSSNYNLTFIKGTFTISVKDITVTADDQGKTYGDADPALTYQITSGSLVGSDSFTGAISRVAGESVGTYDIEQGTLALSSNYNLTFIKGTFTISVKDITVTADDQGKTYGDADPALTYQITSGSLVGSDSFTGAIGRVAGESVGTYDIEQGTLALSSNYNLTFIKGTFTISVKDVTVTADDQGKTYGDADPALTYQITSGSLVGSDSFTGALSRVAGENVGTYDIEQGTLGPEQQLQPHLRQGHSDGRARERSPLLPMPGQDLR